jgi:tetratricopeptide (TPR) repeat protein
MARAAIHSGLGWLAERRHRSAEALDHLERAYDLRQAAGNRLLQAMALNDLGYGHALVGNHQQAMDYCERALAETWELDDPGMEAAILHSLGFIRQQLGDHRQAIACYERSLKLTQALGDLFDEAERSARSATPRRARATPRPPATHGAKRCVSSRRSGIPTPS